MNISSIYGLTEGMILTRRDENFDIFLGGRRLSEIGKEARAQTEFICFQRKVVNKYGISSIYMGLLPYPIT